MAELRKGIVAILDANRTSVGMGIVVDAIHVITCSHVVNVALGEEERKQEKPSGDRQVQIIFPYSSSENRAVPIPGTVEVWHRVFLGTGKRPDIHDVAVVKLTARAPDDVGFTELVRTDPASGTPFDVYRHDTGNTSGTPARGETSIEVENGHIVLYGKDFLGKFIERGFSGAACWSTGYKTIGMVVSVWKDAAARVGHMIPASTLRKVLQGIVPLTDCPPPDDCARSLCSRAQRCLESTREAVDRLATAMRCYDQMLREHSSKADRCRFVIDQLMASNVTKSVTAMIRSYLDAAQDEGVGSQNAIALEELCNCLLPVLYTPEQLKRLGGTALHDGALFSIPAQYESTAELIMARLEARPVQYKFTDGPDAQPVGERLLPSPPEGGLARDNTTFADDFQRHLSAKLVPTGVRILRPEEEVDAINEVLNTMADLGEYRHYYVYTRSTDFGVNEKRQLAARAVQDRFPNIVFFALDAPKDPRLELRIVELLKRILRKRAEGESAS